MNILVVDDHPMVRHGIIAALSFEKNIAGIGEAGNVEQALIETQKRDYDLLIIDLNLKEEDGLSIVKKLKKRKKDMKYIILTSSSKGEDFKRALEIGVHGYVLKDAFAEDIIYAINVVMRDKTFFDSEMMNNSKNQEEKFKGDKLTRREKQVFEEVQRGLSNREIGDKLFISENTVKKHVSSILSKLNLNQRTQVAIMKMDIA